MLNELKKALLIKNNTKNLFVSILKKYSKEYLENFTHGELNLFTLAIANNNNINLLLALKDLNFHFKKLDQIELDKLSNHLSLCDSLKILSVLNFLLQEQLIDHRLFLNVFNKIKIDQVQAKNEYFKAIKSLVSFNFNKNDFIFFSIIQSCSINSINFNMFAKKDQEEILSLLDKVNADTVSEEELKLTAQYLLFNKNNKFQEILLNYLIDKNLLLVNQEMFANLALKSELYKVSTDLQFKILNQIFPNLFAKDQLKSFKDVNDYRQFLNKKIILFSLELI